MSDTNSQEPSAPVPSQPAPPATPAPVKRKKLLDDLCRPANPQELEAP